MLFNSISIYKGDIQGNGNNNLLITTATQPPKLVVLVFQPQTFEYTDNSGLFVKHKSFRINHCQSMQLNFLSRSI